MSLVDHSCRFVIHKEACRQLVGDNGKGQRGTSRGLVRGVPQGRDHANGIGPLPRSGVACRTQSSPEGEA
jgi:hypothetical protein